MFKLLLACITIFAVAGVAHANTPRSTITADNVNELELGYALSGGCGPFSPDSSLIAVGGKGVYEIATGELIFEHPNARVSFTRDNRYLLVDRRALYDLTTGEELLEFAASFAAFSPDDRFLLVENVGLYELETMERHLPGVGFGAFSPDSRWLAVSGDAVYDLQTFEQHFSIAGINPVFSADSSLVAVNNDAVYELPKGDARFRLDPDAIFGRLAFSPDNHLLARGNDGIYDAQTGERLYTIHGEYVRFSPDSQRLAIDGNGVYNAVTGALQFEIFGTFPNFNTEGDLLLTGDDELGDRLYNLEQGSNRLLAHTGFPTFSPNSTLISIRTSAYCLIYGLPDQVWPYRSGLVLASSPVNVRHLPSANSRVEFSVEDSLAVSARTADGQWFKVFYGEQIGWVSASAVNVLAMPADIPVENP